MTRSHFRLGSRVARWHIFKPKIAVWENFGGSCNGRCLFHGYLAYFRPFGIFGDHLVYFMVIWYILSGFGMLYLLNLANLAMSRNPLYLFLFTL
jgi:hypothetical protein